MTRKAGPDLAAYTETVAEYMARYADDDRRAVDAAAHFLQRAWAEDVPADAVAVLAHLLRFPPGDAFADATLCDVLDARLADLRAALEPLYEFGFCTRLQPDDGNAPVTVLDWPPAGRAPTG